MKECIADQAEKNPTGEMIEFVRMLREKGVLPDAPVAINPHAEVAYDLRSCKTKEQFYDLAERLCEIKRRNAPPLVRKENDSVDIYWHTLPDTSSRIRWYEGLASCREIWADLRKRDPVSWSDGMSRVRARDERIIVHQADYAFNFAFDAAKEFYHRMQAIDGKGMPIGISHVIHKDVFKYSPDQADFVNPPTDEVGILSTGSFFNLSLQWVSDCYQNPPAVAYVPITGTQGIIQGGIERAEKITDVFRMITNELQEKQGFSIVEYAILELEINNPEWFRDGVYLIEQIREIGEMDQRPGRKVQTIQKMEPVFIG